MALQAAWPGLTMLQWLGAKPLYSRPRVSDNNVYAELLFRTARHWTVFPAQGFDSLDEARFWAAASCVGTT